jgi:hypothetical protein
LCHYQAFPYALGVHRHERAVLAPLALLPSHSARSIAKVEVFDDKLTDTTGHGRTAGATCYLAIGGHRFCFTLDDLIRASQCGQVRKNERDGLSVGIITPQRRFIC